MFREALAIVENHFVKYALEQQDILGSEKIDQALNLIPDEGSYNSSLN